MNESQHEKFIRMTTAPVEGLIVRLAIPTILSMLVTTLYNMADTYFVGQLENVSATGAIGVVMPLMSVIQAFGFFFGQGSANYISRELGKENVDGATKMASVGFFSAVFFSGFLALVCMFFLEPLCLLLGSTSTILPYAKEYMFYILLGAPAMSGALAINNQLRFQGNAVYAMIGVMSGAVLNVILDPLFIFVLDMDVSGAALATAISQLISLTLLIIGMLKSDAVTVNIKDFKPSFTVYREMFTGGMPSLARQGLGSIASACLNASAKAFGDPAIAAMTIVSRLMMFLFSVLLGFGQGYQPVCGFNYGAKLYSRVKRAFWFCVITSFCVLIPLSLICSLVAPSIIAIIQSDNAETIEIGATALRYQLASFPVMAWVTMSNMTLQTTGKTLPATIIAMARQGIMFIPAVLILPAFFGLNGLLLAQPVADVLALLIAVPLTLWFLRSLTRLEKEQTT